jgi:hypothetical protein
VVDLIDAIDDKRLHHVVPDQLKARVGEVLSEVVPLPRVERIEHQHGVSLPQQRIDKVGAKKAGAAGDQDAHVAPDRVAVGQLPQHIGAAP